MDFDGIDEVILPVADADRVVAFYSDVLEFEVISSETYPDPQFADVWSLPSAPRRTVLLGKRGSAGGWIRVAEVPELPPPSPAGRPDRSGGYAIDFYLRDPETVEARAAEHYPSRGTPAEYDLPGHAGTLVHEGFFDQTDSGLAHATVGYRPRGTRCVLDSRDDLTVSEVVAVVFSSVQYDKAVAFVRDVLGGQPYLSEEFGGPEIERLLDLAPDERLPMTLFRGPERRNARLEVCHARPPQARPDDTVPRVTATIQVDDLDRIAAALAGGEHGRSTGVVDVLQDGVLTRRVGIRTLHGLSFDLVQRGS
ncbi:MAG TPA: VOC family protein [Marmoricola sp.]|jgi:catechol 2,3-dioxygenase-like lactoylglutathione lyase family enzyme|nr:VOC family protein [Marmoricola sp.]